MDAKLSNPVERNLRTAIARVRQELDRIELLTAALGAFSRSVPKYEPAFQHMPPSLTLSAFEIR